MLVWAFCGSNRRALGVSSTFKRKFKTMKGRNGIYQWPNTHFFTGLKNGRPGRDTQVGRRRLATAVSGVSPLDRDGQKLGRLKGWTLPIQLHDLADSNIVPVMRVDTKGNITEEKTPAAQLLAKAGMHIRDFNALHSPGTNCIYPVKRGIVVAMSHIRAVIIPGALIVFQSHRPIVKEFVRSISEYLVLCRNLTASEGEGKDVDFGLAVLEGVLSAVTSKYERRVYSFEPVLVQTLRELRQNDSAASRYTFHKLLPLRNSLSRFEQANATLLKVIKGLLNSDEDMAKLKISSLNREWKGAEWSEFVRSGHVEVELMLDVYHDKLESYFQASYMMRKQIAATLELLELALDKQRNSLIRLNLHFTIATISVGCGSWIGSIFGMNLTSGLENHPYMFYGTSAACGAKSTSSVVCCTSIASILTYIAGAELTRRTTSKHQSQIMMVNGEKEQPKLKTFTNMDDVQDLMLARLDAKKDKTVGFQEFSKMLRDAAGQHVSDEEADIIFKTFDSNQDGLLSHLDVVNFICNQHGKNRL